jgi:hypothetical protein
MWAPSRISKPKERPKENGRPLAAKNREIGGEAGNLSAAFTLSDGVSRALTLGTLERSLNLRAAAHWKMPYHKGCG